MTDQLVALLLGLKRDINDAGLDPNQILRLHLNVLSGPPPVQNLPVEQEQTTKPAVLKRDKHKKKNEGG
jgi:hypothetical protein